MTVYHVSGFRGDPPDGIKVATYDRALDVVVNDFLHGEIAAGYNPESRSTRTLDGWLVEVDVTIDTSHTVDAPEGTYVMFHHFTTGTRPWGLLGNE